MFCSEFALLLWLAFCSEIMLALKDVYGGLWFYSRDNQNMQALFLMLSLVLSTCAGRMCKTHRHTPHTHIKPMLVASIFATLLKHVDLVVLATSDLL